MSRTILMIASGLSASSLLLVDSAVKGTALLLLATVAVLILRRDSAATRHLVWLLALVALLAVPVLSAMLPAWRVLPEWARIRPTTAEVASQPPSIARPAGVALVSPQDYAQVEFEQKAETARQPAAMPAAPAGSRPAPVAPQAAAAPAAPSWNWQSTLPVAWALVWAIGCGVLILRLLAARWLLWHAERQATVIGSSGRSAPPTPDPIVSACQAAAARLGIRRPVTLLIHPDRTIPVVWGILRCRLLLPAAARQWSGEQLQSVLLHELAHVQRRDTLAQLLAQIACALHWFNPLVWLAAWRLGVERERACDDLVLASGVRPSAYAEHLLDVVTQFAPARWTQSCGLAMARQSSLEGRLIAVLSENQSRRSVTMAVAAIALAVAVGIAVPIAMLRAADEAPAAPAQNTPVQDKPVESNAVQNKEEPQESTKPKDGAKLQPGIEEKLQWGEAVRGLRMALVRPPTLGEPEAREIFDFKLVVQNVSDAPLRFSTASAGPKNPRLLVRKDGVPLAAFTGQQPAEADFVLKPREVAVLRLFPEPTEGQSIVKDGPNLTFSAELTIEKAPEGVWTGKLVTADMAAALAAHGLLPKDKDAQQLFILWNAGARGDGKIPGALIGLLAESVTTFTKYNPTGETTPQLLKMLTSFDATRDWSGPDALALLDELAAVQSSPISMALDKEFERTIRTGTPLPPELAGAPWGEAHPSGLRLAWLLEPRAAEHRLGTPLKSRILIHNAGKEAVVFRTRTWHQSAEHQARDAQGAGIKNDSTSWTTRGRLVPFRLAPGEFIEVIAAGIGVGANKDADDWQNSRVGSWIDAKAGDDVTFTPAAVPLSDWNEKSPPAGEPGWWLDHITARLRRTLPLPADKAEREILLYRAAMDLFGTPVSAEINAAFVADREPDALDSLAKRLASRAGQIPFTGLLQSGPTKFRVLPADPDAAIRPRVASNPGRYTLGDNIRLVVSRRPIGERLVNEATIQFFASDPKADPPGKPVALPLPDGYSTWAAAWMRGGTVLWVQQKDGLSSYDFTNPAEVKETVLSEPAARAKVPQPVRDALRAVLDALAAPKPAPATPKPAPATESQK